VYWHFISPTYLKDKIMKKDFIPFAKPSIGKDEEKAIIEVLKSGWLTTGEKVKEFEQKFAEFVGIKYAIAVSSATAGLHLGLVAVNIYANDYVITTPYTFTASAEIIEYCNGIPLFVDIEEDTYNIDFKEVEKKIYQLKKVPRHQYNIHILPVHMAGLPCNINAINKIKRNYRNISIIEDAAHSFPVKYKNKYIGTIGDIGVYSFYATKPVTTGEGGMIVTNNAKRAERIKKMRHHGIDRECYDRYNSIRMSWKYKVVTQGYKYNMTDMAAAIGIEQLKKADKFLERRKEIAKKYIARLKLYDFISIPKYTDVHAWHLFIIKINVEKLKITRNKFIELLFENGVGVSVHFIPLHLMPYYQKKYGYKIGHFPIAENNFLRSISLPIYPLLTDEQIYRIISTVIKIGVSNYKRQGK
jgi:dTDP-4-amino-4,6-dideoxygalactose transaminase